MADRVGVISGGELILVEDKAVLMRKLGRKTLRISLSDALSAIPASLAQWPLTLQKDGTELEYVFDSQAEQTGISDLLGQLSASGIGYKDLHTQESSLEDIFVNLVHKPRAEARA